MNNHETLKLSSEVNEYYSDVKIKHWILDYASTKTWGKDGIHIVKDPKEDPENPIDVDILVTAELKEILDSEIGEDPYLENNLL
jgi:hypothetical protein